MNTKHFTRKQYMNKEVSHHDYYSQFVTESTKRFVLGSLTVEQIKEAIDSGDEHLNKIKIPYNNMSRGGGWWWDDAPCDKHLFKDLGESNTPSTNTCVAKAAARILIEENK